MYVTIATASANTLSAVSENRVSSLPFLISTACSDGILRFWTCDVRDSSENSSEWTYSWTECGIKKPGTSMANTDKVTSISGIPVSIDCANTGRIAVVVRQGNSHGIFTV